MSEFWRDQQMDLIIQTIIDIFKSEGIELVKFKNVKKDRIFVLSF
jgi:hypothetical protein